MKLFQRAERSLFGEILDWMLTPLLLLVPVSIGVTWLVAQGIANGPFDRALEANVRNLASLVNLAGDQATFHLPVPARQMLRADEHDQVWFQVRVVGGELLDGDPDLPRPPIGLDARPGEVVLRDEQVRGQSMRMASTWVRPASPRTNAVDSTPDDTPALSAPVGPPSGDVQAQVATLESTEADRSAALATSEGVAGGPATGPLVLVQVAETREKQAVLVTEILKGVLLPQFAILPLAILLIWLALVRGIKPLSELEQTIRERKPGDLSPLDEGAVPYEVAPLVASVNELLTKLKESVATQKRFLADAAHQLKTPLAGLRMQADLAQREDASQHDLKLSLQNIGRASMRATHSVNQLLSMARAEGGSAALGRQPCDLARLTIEVVREAVPRALDKGIDLGYEGLEPGAPGVEVEGNPTLLGEMVRNLLDNAIAYLVTDEGGHGEITARVLADPFGHIALLQIEDSGPGIPAHERELVFQPFYRVLGNEADGSGLGLPIVREIARQHRATVHLEDARPGRHPPGTRFTVRFDTGPATTAP